MLVVPAILTGLLAGVLHVVTGPDHLAAVAPLAADSRRRGWSAGLMWGLGHSGGTWVLAAIALSFREAIRVEVVSAWSECLVGVVLIGVGLWALKRVLSQRIHAHQHAHDGVTHTHAHAHGPLQEHGHVHTHGALGIGALHGLAGTSHLLGILPALALPTRSDAIGYVAAFGVGSILAMTLFAGLVGLLTNGNGTGRHVYRAVMLASSVSAVALGIYWLYDSTHPAPPVIQGTASRT